MDPGQYTSLAGGLGVRRCHRWHLPPSWLQLWAHNTSRTKSSVQTCLFLMMTSNATYHLDWRYISLEIPLVPTCPKKVFGRTSDRSGIRITDGKIFQATAQSQTTSSCFRAQERLVTHPTNCSQQFTTRQQRNPYSHWSAPWHITLRSSHLPLWSHRRHTRPPCTVMQTQHWTLTAPCIYQRHRLACAESSRHSNDEGTIGFDARRRKTSQWINPHTLEYRPQRQWDVTVIDTRHVLPCTACLCHHQHGGDCSQPQM